MMRTQPACDDILRTVLAACGGLDPFVVSFVSSSEVMPARIAVTHGGIAIAAACFHRAALRTLWQNGFHQHHVVVIPLRQVEVEFSTCRPGVQERCVDAAGELP